jgi:hypothetical protein
VPVTIHSRKRHKRKERVRRNGGKEKREMEEEIKENYLQEQPPLFLCPLSFAPDLACSLPYHEVESCHSLESGLACDLLAIHKKTADYRVPILGFERPGPLSWNVAQKTSGQARAAPGTMETLLQAKARHKGGHLHHPPQIPAPQGAQP